jgi:hypothetical protein
VMIRHGVDTPTESRRGTASGKRGRARRTLTARSVWHYSNLRSRMRRHDDDNGAVLSPLTRVPWRTWNHGLYLNVPGGGTASHALDESLPNAEYHSNVGLPSTAGPVLGKRQRPTTTADEHCHVGSQAYPL